jgi:chromosome segregation ATPase
MATVVATKLLTFAVEKVGSAVAGKVFEKGLAYISGGTDTDKIQQSISDVLKEVQQVKAAVTEMSKKLDEGILRLRKDTLGGPLADIESYYSSVQDCIDQALVDKKDIQDQAALKEALTKLQTRLESKLKLAADNVPGYLGRVDDFLQDKEFLNAGADQAWQKSDDFLAYYMKMKVLVRTSYLPIA